jgi:hypothetical protein
MIILDTNIVSALMRSEPEPAVVRWLDRQPAESLWLTSITVLEVLLGLARLPAGRRQRALQAAFAGLLEEDLGGRVLDFDRAAAAASARLAAAREAVGRPVDLRDTQIAGIALARRSAIATRNTRHFGDLSIPVLDPWAPVPPG